MLLRISILLSINTLSLIFTLTYSSVLVASNASDTLLNAINILNYCIKVHDPNDQWHNLKSTFEFQIERENFPLRQFFITIDNKSDHFEYKIYTDSLKLKQGIKKDKHYVDLNGNKNPGSHLITKYNLTPSRTEYLKNTYNYLMGMPMHLLNKDANLENEVGETNFNGFDCFVLKVKYQPYDQKEKWMFYIDKNTFLLRGCKFYLNDVNNDGEYIYYEDYHRVGQCLIAKTKKWFWNKDDSFFRTDSIISIF